MTGQTTDGTAGAGARPGERVRGALEELVEALDAVVWEADAATTRFHFVSESAERLFGYPRARWLNEDGFWAETVLHPDDRDRMVRRREELAAEGRSHALEYRIRTADGRVLWVRDSAQLIDAPGAARLRGLMLDVSEQKEAADRAVELAHEQAAREQAEAEQRRTRFLASASNVLASSLDYQATLNNLAHLAVPELADWCAVDIVTDDGTVRRLVAAHTDPEKERLAAELDRRYPPDPDAPSGVPQVLRTGEPELVPEIPDALIEAGARDEEHLRIIRDLQLRSYMIVPLIARGRTLGAITFVAAESGVRYGDTDLRFATDLAQRAALAVDNARLYRDAERARQGTTQILESITDAFFALDRDWRFRYLNDEAERLLQRGRAELLGRSVWDEFPDAVGTTFHTEYLRAAESAETRQFTAYYPPLASWFEVRAYPSAEGLSVYFRNVNEQVEAERALVASEERFRSLVRATAAIVWTVPASGEFGGEQPEWTAFTGQTHDEYSSHGWIEAIHPDDRARTARAWASALEARTPYEVEHRLCRHDREYRRMLARAVPIVDDDGSVREWVGVHTDITEQAEAEEALRYQSMLTQTITDNATSALFMMDARGHCTFMNPAAERMIGYSLDEIRDMPLHDAIHHHYPDGRPFPIHECPIDRALPEDFSVRAHEDLFFRKNGEAFPVACAAAPIFGDDRRPIGTVVEVRDVTEEKRAQAALVESERQFRFLADSIPVQVWTARPDGSLDYVSRRVTDYFGQSEAAVLGAGWQDVVHPEHLPTVVERWGRSLQTGEAYEAEFPLQSADGQYRWHMARAVAQRDSEGRVIRWFGSNMNIQAHKEAEAERERLIQALDAERSRLRQIFQEAPAFIAVLRGPEHVFETANPAYVQLVGHRDVRGRTVAEALPEVVDQGFVDLLDRVFQTQESFVGNEMPVMLQREPGGALEQLFVNFVYQPIVNIDGATEGIFVHGVDVTPQVHARRQIEAHAAERTATLSQIADGVIISDAEGNITFINDAARRIHGNAEIGIGIGSYTEVYQLLTLDDEPYPPEDLPLARAVLRGESTVDARWKIRRPDGVVVIAQGSASPVQAEDGRLLGAVLTLRDITAERELQEALDQERMRLQRVFMHAPAVIAMYTGPEHVVSMVNPIWEKVVGKKDVLGKSFREVFPELDGTGLYDLLDRVYRTGEPYVGNEVEIPLDRHGAGQPERTYWNFIWQPLADAAGQVRDVFVHAVEVTDQVRARQQIEEKAAELTRLAQALERSNRELDQFAYVTSHDLKAPLRGIANLSQWVEEDLGDAITTDVHDHLALMRGRVHRMESLIDGILEYSRAGRVQGEPETVDIGELLADVVDLLDPREGVRVRIADTMPTLVTERLPLQQVFMNLIGNAVKYLGRGEGEIRVEVAPLAGAYRFSVADDGPGIAPEYHERIFGIFQTLQARDKVEGTGIGLSLVKKIVENRHGRVWVESAEGEGATFHFIWPV